MSRGKSNFLIPIVVILMVGAGWAMACGGGGGDSARVSSGDDDDAADPSLIGDDDDDGSDDDDDDAEDDDDSDDDDDDDDDDTDDDTDDDDTDDDDTGDDDEVEVDEVAFNIIDAEYSEGLDRAIIVSTKPTNALITLDLEAGTWTTISLSKAPLGVSVDPAGKLAAVNHGSTISHVDISEQSIRDVYTPSESVSDVVLTSKFIYAVPDSGEWTRMLAIRLSDGEEFTHTGDTDLRHQSVAKLARNDEWIYTADTDLKKTGFSKFDVDTESGVPAYVRSNPVYDTDDVVCGDFWYAFTGGWMITRCANVIAIDKSAGDDMKVVTKLEEAEIVKGMAVSPASNQVVVLLDNGTEFDQRDSRLVGLSASGFHYEKDFELPEYDDGEDLYTIHGDYVFFVNDNHHNKFYVLGHVDETSGLNEENTFRLMEFTLFEKK
ncbi:MAG: hypothetical protein H6684_16690 [Deltaproteobacteria bacterium]|nr:hypothetical protein [Deltaproteobacteria bacterium]MCB9490372.1 hypothetical protein [Deltaproteobacteria bacterium]